MDSNEAAEQTAHLPPPKKKKKDKGLELDEALLSNLTSLEDSRAERAARHNQPKDQEALFGEQVAGTLRRLPPRKRELTKIKITTMLFDAEFPDGEDMQ